MYSINSIQPIINSKFYITDPIQIIGEVEHTSIGGYTINRPRRIIGSGAQGWVELATKDGKQYIIKFSMNQVSGENEYRIMDHVRHENIIKVFGFYKNIKRRDATGKLVTVSALIMEYAEHGELFSLVDKNVFGTNNQMYMEELESYVRIIFTQLLDAISCCHRNGIVHLDIKLENILLDKDWNVKVSDFGLALNGYIQNIKHGTPMYYPPEFFTPIHTYDGRKVDIFSAGIVLFILLMGYQPWTRLDDEFYSCIRDRDFTRFWDLHAAYGRVISRNAKSLLNRMFEEPDFRITIEGIKKSAWFTTPNLISKEDMVQRFDKYTVESKQGKRRSKRRNGRKTKSRNPQRRNVRKLKIPKLIRN